MTPDNSGMPPLPEPYGHAYYGHVSWLNGTAPVWSEEQIRAYGRQVAQMCAEICRDSACGGSAFNSAAEYIEAQIRQRFNLEKP